MPIRTLIVDDEPLAREGIAMKLNKEPDIEIVGECENGSEAIAKITSLKPDLVFLDIRMPAVNGFDVIRQVGIEQMPLVIFLTAYDEFALEAFQHNAQDYLLKPIDPERLQQSLQKIRRQFVSQSFTQNHAGLQELLESVRISGQQELSDKIIVRSSGRVFFLAPAGIDWIESEGDYINIHTPEKSHLVRDTMQAMEQKLAPYGFLRIHRSAIVHRDRIRELKNLSNGEYEVCLTGGISLKLGRNYREAVFSKLGLT